MPEITFILPIYNAARYLRDTLNSIAVQKEIERCEVILINDGSKDNSLEICREYEQEFDFIRVVDKPNEGVSATRNKGIDLANGKYIYFMDADDLLHPDFLKIVYATLRDSHPDIIVWQYMPFYASANYSHPTNNEIKVVDNFDKRAFNYLSDKGCGVSLWTKLFKTEIIGDQIRFDEKMTYGEDMFFCWKAILKSDLIMFIPQPLYYYRQVAGNATSKFHKSLYENYHLAFSEIDSFCKGLNYSNAELFSDIDYHFACRIPSLTAMESRAPYSRKEQAEHLKKVLSDIRICRALTSDDRLKGEIYDLARQGKVEKMLRNARVAALKSKLLRPIKRLIK